MTVEERIKQQRDKKLIELGYCTREYKPKSCEEVAYEYPLYDEKKKEFYRLVAVDVSDEQFEQIFSMEERVKKSQESKTTLTNEPTSKSETITTNKPTSANEPTSTTRLASTLTILAWIGFVCFILMGLINANNAYPNGFSIFLTFVGIGTGCLLSLLWFAEVLNLLQGIRDKL